MLRLLPMIIELALLVLCLVDALQTPPDSARNLPKWAWLVVILLVPYAGPIAWIVAGRPRHGVPAQTQTQWPVRDFSNQSRVVAPDDDPEFLEALRRQNQRDRDRRRSQEGNPDQHPGDPGTPASQ